MSDFAVMSALKFGALVKLLLQLLGLAKAGTENLMAVLFALLGAIAILLTKLLQTSLQKNS